MASETRAAPGLCECGCGGRTRIATKTAKKDGHVRGQPLRFLRNHRRRVPFAERFWSKVDRRGKDACWPWLGALNHYGYGRIFVDGRPRPAHRVAFKMTHGQLLNGLHVLHRCDNPPCVNPAHLFAGTHADNMHDRKAKGRGVNPRGERHGCARLRVDQVRAIRRAHTEGESQASIARRYGVAWQTIGHIVRHETWRHVD